MTYLTRPDGYKFGKRKVNCVGRGLNGRMGYYVECECGQIDWITKKQLESGNSNSCRKCGAVQRHADRGSIYATWPSVDRDLLSSLKARYHATVRRCHGDSPDAEYYRDRGIECRFADVKDYLSYVLTLPGCMDRSLQVDRRDNDGHYERGNLRFVTGSVNCLNRRSKWRNK